MTVVLIDTEFPGDDDGQSEYEMNLQSYVQDFGPGVHVVAIETEEV